MSRFQSWNLYKLHIEWVVANMCHMNTITISLTNHHYNFAINILDEMSLQNGKYIDQSNQSSENTKLIWIVLHLEISQVHLLWSSLLKSIIYKLQSRNEWNNFLKKKTETYHYIIVTSTSDSNCTLCNSRKHVLDRKNWWHMFSHA